VGGRLPPFATLSCASAFLVVQKPPVLVVVAIDAKVLPVAAVGGVVFVVVVFVVHSEHMEALDREFPATASADPGMNSEGLLSVAFHALI
jgi:hypothetical protein